MKTNKVIVITDSSAGFSSSELKENLAIVPMPFMIDDEEFYEGVNLTKPHFYESLKSDKKISTSQPSPGDITSIWDEQLKKYDEIVYIPLSSSLSMSYQTALMLSSDYKGKVQVVDAKRVSVTQKQACLDALYLISLGKNAKEIKENALNSSIYIMVDTLKYLKRGGRITPVVAAFGALLKIKPVLQIQGDKLDNFAKVLNVSQAKQKMISAIKRDIDNRFLDDYVAGNLQISMAHTNNEEKLKEFAQEVKKAIPNVDIVFVDELPLIVACHIGEGALAISVTKKIA